MKKYFPKIIVIFLLVTIFQMTSGICLQNLSLTKIKVNVAQAAQNDITGKSLGNVVTNNMTICGNEAVESPLMSELAPSIANAIKFEAIGQGTSALPVSHSNSLLPCCQNGGHPNVISSYQSGGIEKFIPVFSCSNINLIISTPEKPFYNTPIMAPPELFAIKITTLRI